MKYVIAHQWQHVEGHIATTRFNNYETESESDDAAIEAFSKSDHVCAKHVRKDDEGWFYGSRDVFRRFQNKVIAIPIIN